MTNTIVGDITLKKNCWSSFNWNIPQFNAVLQQHSSHNMANWLMSPPLHFNNNSQNPESKWHVYVRKTDDGNLNCFVKLLGLKSSSTSSSGVSLTDYKFRVSLGNVKNPNVVSKDSEEAESVENEDYKGWRFYPYINALELAQKRRTIIEDGTLRLSLDIYLEPGPPDPSKDSLRQKRKLSDAKFFQDFESLFEAKKFCDVKIVCGGQTFSCHKSILSARSKVFAVMFETNMSESSEGKVHIEDMDPGVVEVILGYMYKGNLDLPENSPIGWMDLIHGAEKYELVELKNYCFAKLIQILSEENAGIITVAAYTYNSDEETQKTVKEFCQSHIGTLLKKASFRKLFLQNSKAFYDDDEDED